MLTIASVSRPPGVFAGVGARAELVLYGANLLPLDLRTDEDLPEPKLLVPGPTVSSSASRAIPRWTISW